MATPAEFAIPHAQDVETKQLQCLQTQPENFVADIQAHINDMNKQTLNLVGCLSKEFPARARRLAYEYTDQPMVNKTKSLAIALKSICEDPNSDGLTPELVEHLGKLISENLILNESYQVMLSPSTQIADQERPVVELLGNWLQNLLPIISDPTENWAPTTIVDINSETGLPEWVDPMAGHRRQTQLDAAQEVLQTGLSTTAHTNAASAAPSL
jgi:hypothetical protein